MTEPSDEQPRSTGARVETLCAYGGLVVLLALFPARAFLPGDVRWLDVLGSFVPQFWVLSALAMVWFGVRRQWLRTGAFLLLMVPDAALVMRLGLETESTGTRLASVYAANLSEDARAVSLALEDLEELAPDLVWFSEFPVDLPEETAQALGRLEAAYPYGLTWHAAEGRSLRFLSRHPVQARDEFNPPWAPGRPAVQMLLEVDGIPLIVHALHTHPPAAAWSFEARNQTLAWVAQQVAAEPSGSIVIGDLNLSAHSPAFREFIRASGLRCASPWRCAVNSWPAWAPVFLTPIDHVLASGPMRVVALRRGRNTGSDHYPLFAEIAVELDP